MIDLTQNEYDKELFITDVLLGKENDKYLVKYADGSERIENFSVHNFNATLLRMEKQYLQYRDEYYKKLCVERLGLTLKSIGNLIINITSVYLLLCYLFSCLYIQSNRKSTISKHFNQTIRKR